jgi:hypothetical protein
MNNLDNGNELNKNILEEQGEEINTNSNQKKMKKK